jgi:beta-galactosidase
VVDLPRVGVVFGLPPRFGHLRWFGPGPDETYPDRRAAAMVGLWASTVEEQLVPYVRPQEHGHHTDFRWFELTDADGAGIRVTAVEPARLGFSARLHGDAQLGAAFTAAELEAGPDVEVHVDLAQRGLGTAACGPDTRERFRIGPGTYRWSWLISPVPPAPGGRR